MSEITLIVLGIRLAIVAFKNRDVIGQDAAAFNGIVGALLAGKHPTEEQWATFAQLTQRLIAADLAAVTATRPPDKTA